MSNKMNRDTLGDISRRAAARYADKTAIRFRDKELTYIDLERKACSFANLMLRLGVKKGDRVAINSFNSHHYPISLLGLAKIGAVQVPVNYMLNAEEVDYVVTHSGARVFLVEDALLPQLQAKKGLFKNIALWGMIPLAGAGIPTGFFDLDYEMAAMPADDPDIKVSPEDIIQIPYTSGTESRPKGAMLSHRALMSQYFSCLIDGQYEQTDVSLHGLPLFHCAQLHCFLMPFLYTGAENIILHRADPLDMLENIERYRVTHMFAPPTVWISLLNHPRLRDFNLTSLRKAAYGASIMPVEIIKQLTDTFPGLRLWNYYGQTEMGPVATILKPEDQLMKPGSAGRAVINVETRLMDDEGNFVPLGQVEYITRIVAAYEKGWAAGPE
jgi:fatty-acyl-CoA synthase